MVADKRSLMFTHNRDDVFSKTGFYNWKKALEKFEKHQNTNSQHEAVELVVSIPGTTKDVGRMLCTSHAEQKAENREMLKVILSSTRYLGRQGLALRGHYKAECHSDSRGEPDHNFIQLLKTRAEYKPSLLKWMEKAQDKFSPDIQNEILSIMALRILREIACEVSGKWYSVMVDETTDLSNTEQMVMCLRYVDDTLEVHEELIGMYSLESTSAESILSMIKDVLLCLNLRINDYRGQRYDGASSISGAKSGVATRLATVDPRALYTHCYGHALNLATQYTLKGIKVMEDTLNTVYEITKLVKKSPKRDTIFQKFKDVAAGSPGIRTLPHTVDGPS